MKYIGMYIRQYQLKCKSGVLSLGCEPIIMGVLNVTPDSFSDGGEFFDTASAVTHGMTMVCEGAGIIDIGGESTRPGAKPVSADQQIARVTPVIKTLADKTNTPISIDTTSSKVAKAALDAGASIINDISALRFDKEMAALAAQRSVPIILMHMLGTPADMQQKPSYLDVVQEVKQFLADRIAFAVAEGVDRSQIVVDPGIGFGKTVEHNLQLLNKLKDLNELGVPILVGPSRKSFIGKVLNLESPGDRLFGTAAAVAHCVSAGVQIIRVHDVKEMSQTAKLSASIIHS